MSAQELPCKPEGFAVRASGSQAGKEPLGASCHLFARTLLALVVPVATSCWWPAGMEWLPGAVGKFLGGYLATEAGCAPTTMRGADYHVQDQDSSALKET